MKVTLLDTQTGKTKESEGLRTFEWAENNWSCDCNREIIFFGFDCTPCRSCLGCNRFIVIKAEVETDDDYECSLFELNEGYPPDLLAKHGIYPNNNTGKTKE